MVSFRRTGLEYVSEYILIVFIGCAVPAFVSELVLAFLDAFVGATGDRVDDARVLHTYFHLFG